MFYVCPFFFYVALELSIVSVATAIVAFTAC
jgi:hypothetical protein